MKIKVTFFHAQGTQMGERTGRGRLVMSCNWYMSLNGRRNRGRTGKHTKQKENSNKEIIFLNA